MYLQKIMTLGLQERLWPDLECLTSLMRCQSCKEGMHPLLLPRTMCTICYAGDMRRMCQSPLYNPSVLQPLLLLTSSFSGKATAVRSVCTLSNHTFLPKVRFPYVCLVINVPNLWQISLSSCFSCPSE